MFCLLSVVNGAKYKLIVSIFDHFVGRQILVWRDRMKVNVLIDIIASSFEPGSSSLSKSIAKFSLSCLNQCSSEHQIFCHDEDDWNIRNDFLKHFWGDISPFCGATDTPVLEFWWRLLWVSKPGWAALFALDRGVRDIQMIFTFLKERTSVFSWILCLI